MIRAIVFDMDGVLVDAGPWHFEALNRALRLFGYGISLADHQATFDGLPTRVKLDKLIEKRGLPRGLSAFIAELKQTYTLEIVRRDCRPTFSHEFALSRLKAEGYRIAVASNSVRETVDTMMAKTCLTGYLDLALCSEDVAAAKPDPEIYLLAAEKLGVAPAECLVVEDNHNGIKAARTAGAALMQVTGVEDVSYDRIKERIAAIDLGNWIMNVLFLGAAPNAPGAEDNRYPAWLAEIDGRSLLERIARPLVVARHRLIYCFLGIDIHKFHLREIVTAVTPGQPLIAVEGTTRGAACTALLAADMIDDESELLIVSLNEYLEADLASAVGDFRARELDAGTLVFDSLHPRYSYVRVGADDLVVEAAQGRPISNAATVGAFWFRRGADFVEGVKQMIRKHDHLAGNYYICPVFNQMILMHRRIGVSWIAVDRYHPLKTEAQIHQFEFEPKSGHG